jgi:hypothetical protein
MEIGALMRYVTGALILVATSFASQAGTRTRPPDQLSDCEWKGPTAEWVLARRPPVGTIAGPVGSALAAYLRDRQIPISFVPAAGSEARVHIEVTQAATVRDVLEEMQREAPQYQYRTVDGKIVIYPRNEGFDDRLDLGQVRRERRGGAYLFVLGALRAKVSALRDLSVTLRGGQIGSGKRLLADDVEVGGTRTVIEHLISLIQGRPSGAFTIASYGEGHIAYDFAWVDLLNRIDIEAPAKVQVGESLTIKVTGTLVDGTKVPLVGSACGVSYSAAPDVWEIDDGGHAVAHKRGAGTLYAEYERHSASAEVDVE